MADTESNTSASSGSSQPLVVAASRVRKRVDSETSESTESVSTFKRPRLSLSRTMSSSSLTTGHSIDSPRGLRPMTPERSMFLSTFSSITTPPQNVDAELARLRARPLSRRSSMSAPDSRPGSPGRTMVNPLEGFPGLRDRIIRPRADSSALLRRSVSAASLYTAPSPSPPDIVYAEESAKTHMQLPKFVVDFTTPTPASPSALASSEPTPELPAVGGPAPAGVPAPVPSPPVTDPRLLEAEVQPSVLACSSSGYLFFTRNNRLHFKNLMANEEVGQLCKLKDSHGSFSAVACGSEENPNVVAYATTSGSVAIYDVQTKQRVLNWSTRPVTALAWNNKTLTVGYVSGAIRHYDTRQTTFPKLRDQSLLLATRHQSPITRLAWNVDGRLLASADQQGNVLCWKVKEKVPLEVGEPGQTRMKKIKHNAAISALGWCPWAAKVLVTADVKGIAHLWRLDHELPGTNAMNPGKIETGAAITGIQWSMQCKEFVTTHGYKIPEDPTTMTSSRQMMLRSQPPSTTIENSISVWQYPTARFVTNIRVSHNEVPLGNSATCAGSTKVVFTIPDDGKIYISDVWAKRKQHKLKRQSSLDFAGQIR